MMVGIRAWQLWFIRKDSVTCNNLIFDKVVCCNNSYLLSLFKLANYRKLVKIGTTRNIKKHLSLILIRENGIA